LPPKCSCACVNRFWKQRTLALTERVAVAVALTGSVRSDTGYPD
jgi:hypothetical protein